MQSCLYHQAEAESGRLYEPGKDHYGVSFHGSPTPLGQGSCLGVSRTGTSSSLSVPSGEPAIAPSASAKPVPSVTSEQYGRESLGTGSGELSHSTVSPASPSQLQATLKMFQQALAIAQAKNNRINQVNILKRIGIIHCKLGEHAWGIKCLKQALQLAQALRHPVSVGIILNYLGAAYRQTGQEHKALRVYLRALDIVKGIGNEAGVALLLNHLGAVYNSLGQSDQALSCSRQALEKLQDLGNAPDGEATALHTIGEIYLQMRRYRQALAFLEQALAIEQKIGNRKGEAKVVESIATVYVRINQERQALELYQRALKIRREVGDSPHVEARCLDYIGAIHYKSGNRSRALWHHLQALGMLQAHNYAFGSDRFLDDTVAIAKLLQNVIIVYDRLGLHSQGMKCYQQALDIIGTFGENACEEAIHNFLEQDGMKNS
ncbi:tetratricopeptide repeat protein [Allocoleopsis sp.]|uniref:tetratricopeptide repeat protein n=1 Tax=Allocoleopsis sp. TaxID=3088169 RepID=UPI002FD6F433